MKKGFKISLIALGSFILLLILIGIFIPESKISEQEKAAKQQKEIKQQITAQEVELSYGDHARITHQRLIDTIEKAISGELEDEDYDYRLEKITVEDKVIIIRLDLQFVPPSKSWIIKEGRLWAKFVACTGIWDDNYNLIGNVYSTGYNICVLMWTNYDDTGKVIPWGHATIFNSGQPFSISRINAECRWTNGKGMELLK